MGTVVPSPNIWHWPEVYERENRAQDAAGAIWAALLEVCDWAGADVVDIGCGDGFHLPVFARSARAVVGVEPHPPLVRRARERVAGLRGVRVVEAGAERVPLPDAGADLVHARTAYFFGPGCEPGMAEADRLLRPGGVLAIVDLDAGRPPYGDWMRADLPHYDPAGVERYFDRLGFTLRRVNTEWRFPDRASLEAVLGIEFSAPVARAAIAATDGLTLSVGYRIHTRRKPAGLLLPGSALPAVSCPAVLPGSALPGRALPGSALPGRALLGCPARLCSAGCALPGSALPGHVLPGRAARRAR